MLGRQVQVLGNWAVSLQFQAAVQQKCGDFKHKGCESALQAGVQATANSSSTAKTEVQAGIGGWT